MGSINFRVCSRVRFSFLKKSVIAKEPPGFRSFEAEAKNPGCPDSGRSIDGPENVKLFLEMHRLGVHQKKLCIESFAFRCLFCHLDLYWGNGYACDARVIMFGEVMTASADRSRCQEYRIRVLRSRAARDAR